MTRPTNVFTFIVIYSLYGFFLFFGPISFSISTYITFCLIQAFYHKIIWWSPWLWTSCFIALLLLYFVLLYHLLSLLETTLSFQELYGMWATFCFYCFPYAFYSRYFRIMREKAICALWEAPLSKEDQEFKDKFTRAHRYHNDW